MSQDYFNKLKDKFSNIVAELQVLDQRIKELDAKEEWVKSKTNDLNLKEKSLTEWELEVSRRESQLTLIKEEAKQERLEANAKQEKLKATIEELERQKDDVSKRIDELVGLEQKEAEIKTKAEMLKAKEKDLIEREAIIEKSAKVDRERKQLLDERESNLDREKQRIQKITGL